MVLGALLSVLVLAAPEKGDEVRNKLRIAWASQYEWREDKLRNVTLEFDWERKRTDGNGREDLRRGTGQVVVVGSEVVRRHIEGPPWFHKEVAGELDWVLGRYVRKSFEEQFKGIELELLDKTVSGADRIRAGKTIFVIQKDRILAEERDIGRKTPRWIRVDFKLDDMGDGYARMREFFSAKSTSGAKRTTTRALEPRSDSDLPMPAGFTLSDDRPKGERVSLTLTFRKPRVDLAEPIIIETAARDLLQQAWLHRYVLPPEIRIVAEFQRKPDKNLNGFVWPSAKGKLQVWGMDQIEVEIDEKYRRRSGRASITESCLAHIRALFDFMKDTPFAKEFEHCGFVLKQKGAANQVVRVYGHPWVVAFLVSDGYITGFLKNGDGPDDWNYLKLKKGKDQRALVGKLIRTVEGTKLTAKYVYFRTKGYLIPKRFDAIVVGGFGSTAGTIEYAFKRVRVTLPKN